MIQITKGGTVFSGSTQDLEWLRAQFDRQHCVRLPDFLGPELLEIVKHRIQRAHFQPSTYKGIGSELCMSDGYTDNMMHFLLNNRKLLKAIEEITRSGHLGCFRGRMYRLIPGHGRLDGWHNDLAEHRVVAISINFSTEVYSGGILQIRDRRCGKIVREAVNVGFGDAIIFRLSYDLEHRVTEVEGTVPKTAYAGWFKSQPEFLALLKGHARLA